MKAKSHFRALLTPWSKIFHFFGIKIIACIDPDGPALTGELNSKLRKWSLWRVLYMSGGGIEGLAIVGMVQLLQ